MSSLALEGGSRETQIIFLTRKRGDLQTFHLHGAQLFSTATHTVYGELRQHYQITQLTVHLLYMRHCTKCFVFHPQFPHNFASSGPFIPSHHRGIQGPKLVGDWFPAFCHKCSLAHHVTQHRSESSVSPLSSVLHLRSMQEAWDTFLVSLDISTPHPPDEEMSSL